MSDFEFDGGLWGRQHAGEALPARVGPKTIGSAYIDERGVLHVHIDEPTDERWELSQLSTD